MYNVYIYTLYIYILYFLYIIHKIRHTQLATSVAHSTLDLRIMSSSLTLGIEIICMYNKRQVLAQSGETRILTHCWWWECKTVQPLWKIVWCHSKS